jgi:hypothetical protein
MAGGRIPRLERYGGAWVWRKSDAPLWAARFPIWTWTVGALVISLPVWQEQRERSLFTVGGVYELFVEPRERVTAGIVGYRCAGKEDRRSRVEREGAHDRDKRQPAHQGSLAPAHAISRSLLVYGLHPQEEGKTYKAWAPCAAAMFSIGTTYTTNRHSLWPMRLMRNTKPAAGKTRERIRASRAKPNGMNISVAMRRRGTNVVKYVQNGDTYIGVKVRSIQTGVGDTNAPFSAFAFIHVKIDAGNLRPEGPLIPEIRVNRDGQR